MYVLIHKILEQPVEVFSNPTRISQSNINVQ